MQQGLDLRGYLEQGRAQVIELVDTMSKLVLEVKASHYWTVHGLETISSLQSIGANIEKLLAACEPSWHEAGAIFSREEALKLFKSAGGLYRAIPPVTAKFLDQLDKRRKQRIMGQTFDESAEITPEEMQEALTAFTLRIGEAKHMFSALGDRIAAIPEGLVPSQAALSQVAANAAAQAQSSGGAQAEPTPQQEN